MIASADMTPAPRLSLCIWVGVIVLSAILAAVTALSARAAVASPLLCILAVLTEP